MSVEIFIPAQGRLQYSAWSLHAVSQTLKQQLSSGHIAKPAAGQGHGAIKF